MRKLIDYDDLRHSRDNCFEVHFFECDASVFDPSQRHAFEVADERFGVCAAVSFNKPDNKVEALPLELVGVLEHFQ